MEVDVTEKIISDTRHAIVPSHIRSLAPAPTITPAGHKVLQLVHGMRLVELRPGVHEQLDLFGW